MTTPDRLSAALAGRYRIERELGAGGMATVYLAEDLKHDRKVAIKVLKPELAAVLGAERFVVEIKTTAARRVVVARPVRRFHDRVLKSGSSMFHWAVLADSTTITVRTAPRSTKACTTCRSISWSNSSLAPTMGVAPTKLSGAG